MDTITQNPEFIVLVSCVAEKLPQAAPAKDLYVSDWFKKARKFAEIAGDRWFILSAHHHVVEPNRMLSPYDASLKTMKAADRRVWAAETARQIASKIERPTHLIILAGVSYRNTLLDLLPTMTKYPLALDAPMAHLGIGKQKAWLADQALRRPFREGTRIQHSRRGPGIVDAACVALQRNFNTDPTSIYVRFDGETDPVEVTRAHVFFDPRENPR